MNKSYSIAQARSSFTTLIDEVQDSQSVEITRRGKPVAVLLSTMEYDKLKKQGKKRKGLWHAITRIRNQPHFAGISEGELDFDTLRDQTPARDFKWEI